jgi:hypothetical protein
VALTTTPTFDAGTWFTENAAAIELVYDQLLDVQKQASPTLKILLDRAKTVGLGPDGTVGWNLLHDMYNPRVMTQNQRFALRDIDLVSRMEYTTEMWYNSAATNIVEMTRYGRTGRSRVDLISEKVQAMHRGLTLWANYALFSDWNESLAGDQIDVQTELAASPLPPSLAFEGITGHGQRFNSIPMLIREHETGHTLGNVSSANPHWQISVNNGGAPTRNVTATDEQCDIVTAQNAVLTELSPDDIRTLLNTMQIGAGYELYCICPAALYGVLEDYLVAERRRQPNEQLADIGIDANFKYAAYNTTFYVDPMMNDLWPSTLFFWDPEIMFLLFDEMFFPYIYDWEHIPGTTQYATAACFDGQLVTTDRRGLGVMHGYTAG